MGDTVASFDYGLNAPAVPYDGETKYLRITDIDDETHEFRHSDLTSPGATGEQIAECILNDGDLLFARTGASVGKTYHYQRKDGRTAFAGFLIRAVPKPSFDSRFLYQTTLGSAYDRYISVTSQRSGQPGVNAAEYAKLPIHVPALSEQRQIGILFSDLDNLITLHQ